MTLPSGYLSAVMADTPWALWGMQEAAGATSLADDSGNAHGGTYSAALTTTTGPFSITSAAQFNGQYASIAGVYATGADLAFEFWFRQQSSSGALGLWSYGNSTRTTGVCQADKSMSGCGVNGALDVVAPDSGWICVPSSPVTVNTWYHCVVQHESDNHWRWYIRGSADSTHSVWDLGAHSMTAPTTPTLYISRFPDSAGLAIGDWAACALYSHALTVARMDAHYTAATYTPPPAPCVSRIKSGLPAVQYVNDAVVQAVIGLVPALDWATRLMEPWMGTTQHLDLICADTPEALASPPLSYLSNVPALGQWEYFKALMWPLWCECTPATPTPVPPNQVWTKPPDWPDLQVYVINTTNPCYDITEVRRKLDELLRLVGLDYQIDQTVQKRLVPAQAVRGSTYTGLTGAGSIDVGPALGVQIVVTDRPPNRELEGAPDYVWDIGWASIMDGNGFIEERRITRDVEVWMPRLMSDATTFGYYFKTGVTASVTILFPLP